jgi:O-acetyl-ADP-ribose deacetylase (regulator of RNase III)
VGEKIGGILKECVRLWKRGLKMKKTGVNGLYYITHINNVPSMLTHGIYSHEKIETEHIEFTRIYDENIVANRHDIHVPDGRNLWKFANFFFQARNPMLYRVTNEKSVKDIAIVSVKPNILDRLDIYISTGNAAHSLSDILPVGEGLKILPQILNDTKVEWWNEADGSKRKIMAECLVPDMLPPEGIQAIYVSGHETKEKLEPLVREHNVPIIPEPHMFFLPTWVHMLTSRLYLLQGDMFFSKAQTVTVSVNTVGVMGKGLASRAKYQFPDVYVYYQDLCRSKKLKMGKPQIYKRESSLDYNLADEPHSLTSGNGEKWFLLFPTKRNWREMSDIKGIEEGLNWLVDNYKQEGIKSLAIPALGCGLGRLDWKDVGPLMCKYLRQMDINVFIYIPAEKIIPDDYFKKEYLLA